MTINTIHPQLDIVLDKLLMAHQIYGRINSSDNCPNREIYQQLENHTDEMLTGFSQVFKVDRSEIELDFGEKSKLALDKISLELHGLLIEFSDKKVLEYCIEYEEKLNVELRKALEEAAFVMDERQVLAKAVISSTSLLSTLRKEHRKYTF